ncbi:adenosine kinase [Asaia sp. W19]|uniref:adenosine kinase n=1 Tax=unclassified Asaia TaxID=2685023 RepID=UPI000F8D05E4|nr:adenosine kinase [Asaia sp. W19]RUT24985.1 adenosine kinase [Asaia sp. W19]
MTAPTLDLLCIGNAIVDILAPVSHETLSALGSPLGSMTLIDADQAASIEAQITPEQVMGGGSAANTAVVAARLGARVGYLGKVASDEAGLDYAKDLTAQKLFYPSAPVQNADRPTARCIILVTPDGQRTMHTYLGICTEFGPEDVDQSAVAAAGVTYMEGYLFDKDRAQSAFILAAETAHKAGRRVALTLSDTFCVARHHAAFRALVAGHIDILFANEAEICALYETEDFDAAAAQAGRDAALVVLTRSEKGAVILANGEKLVVPTEAVKVVDTTGAGDAFAAGFLAGLAKGRSLEACGQLGNEAAGAIITRMGARPAADFALKA